jgi:glycosyltransferase involved in cell wall biosynthesis
VSASRHSVLIAVEQLRRAVPGGIGTYAQGLLSGLRAVQDEDTPSITLYASRAVPDPLARLGRPVRTSRLGSRLLTRAWDLGVSRAPAGFDVVHGVSLASPPPAKGERLVVMVHDLAWRSHPESTTVRGRRWHEGALRRALRRADAFVVPSKRVRDDLLGAGALVSRVSVIPEGADHLPEPDRPGTAAMLRACGVEGPYLLTVSTLEPRKNLGRLVEAYGSARPGLPGKLPLVVAGPTGWGDSGVDHHGTDGVVAVGHVSGATLSGLYAGASGFVYVPLAEGFGLPPLEAMAAGAPVVASSAVPSVVEASGELSALVVDPEDTDAIAAALVRVVTDTTLAESLRAGGSALAQARTWASAARAHLDLWRALA